MAGSSSDGGGTPEGVPHATRRTLEVTTAAVLVLIGGVVVAESLTHDIGWNETGPGSGYFPFRVGSLLMGASLICAWQSVRGAGSASTEGNASGPAEVFVTREELRRCLSVFWPTAALVIAMFPLG